MNNGIENVPIEKQDLSGLQHHEETIEERNRRFEGMVNAFQPNAQDYPDATRVIHRVPLFARFSKWFFGF